MKWRVARVSRKDYKTVLAFGEWVSDRDLAVQGMEICAKMNKEYLYHIEVQY